VHRIHARPRPARRRDRVPAPVSFEYGKPHRGARLTPWIGAAVLIAAFGGVIYLLVSALSSQAPPPKPQIQHISLVQPPPPPPPPPQQEEPPPEPEIEEVEVPEEDEPIADDSAADEAPPGSELGLDADGVAGGDAFGLAARKGGRGLIGGGDRFKWYAGVIQRDLYEALSAVESIRKGRYSVIVRIWVDEDGRLQDSEIVRGSGDAGIDAELRRALATGVRVSQAPPEDMPQPIRIRISSRT